VKVTDRDRKILIVFGLVAAVAVYWFLLLGPKRAESAELKQQLADAESQKTELTTQLASLRASKTDFASDYSTIVRLGKAIPTKTDMPSLLVQLESASEGSDIEFKGITASDADEAAPVPAAAPPPAAPQGDAAAGGDKASTGPGKAAETAGNSVNDANGKSSADASTGTSTTAKPGGGVPVGGGSAPGAAAGAPAAAAPGLVSVPIQIQLDGRFFKLADFFHDLKRFVKVANDRISVSGRLITIDSLNFTTTDFPRLKVEVGATAYLSPKTEGAAAGATPQGPGSTAPAAAPSGGGQPAPATPPTASATP